MCIYYALSYSTPRNGLKNAFRFRLHIGSFSKEYESATTIPSNLKLIYSKGFESPLTDTSLREGKLTVMSSVQLVCIKDLDLKEFGHKPHDLDKIGSDFTKFG